MNITRKDKAVALFMEGYNCSQSIFMAFADLFEIDRETAKKISAGLGGGLGRQREVCGAVSGAALVTGYLRCANEGSDQEGKMENYVLVREFCERFKERHGGTIICREMLKIAEGQQESAKPDERTAEYYKKRPCIKAIADAAEILESMISEHEK